MGVTATPRTLPSMPQHVSNELAHAVRSGAVSPETVEFLQRLVDALNEVNAKVHAVADYIAFDLADQ